MGPAQSSYARHPMRRRAYAFDGPKAAFTYRCRNAAARANFTFHLEWDNSGEL